MERVRLSAFHCKRGVSGHEGEGWVRASAWGRWAEAIEVAEVGTMDAMVLFDIFDLWRSVECFIQAFIPRQSGFCCCFFTDV